MDEAPTPPDIKRTNRNWLDMMLALTAIFVSLCSLYLAYNSSDSMERLVAANSMPFLQLESGNALDDGTPGFLAFSVRNAGTGPASVHSFEYIIDDVVMPHRGYVASNVLRACCASELERAIRAANGDMTLAIENDLTSPVANTFLAPNDTVTAWAWRRSQSNAEIWSAVDQARQSGRIRMRACYCSLFDDCWVAETGVFPPRPVNSCAPATTQSEPPSP